MLSIVQNFVCTNPKRLKLLKEQLPIMADIFKDCVFYVNYNSTTYADEIKTLYRTHVQNLVFTNIVDKNWGSTTLRLIREIDTEYLFILCEDFIFNTTYEEFKTIFKNIQSNGVEYFPIGRLWKYTRDEYLKIGTVTDDLLIFYGRVYPGSSLSVDALYKTSDFKEIMKEYVGIGINLSRNRFPVHLPHHFEHSFREPDGVRKWYSDKLCAFPRKEIFIHYVEATECDYKGVY